MTAGDLIRLLQSVPEETEILILDADSGGYDVADFHSARIRKAHSERHPGAVQIAGVEHCENRTHL